MKKVIASIIFMGSILTSAGQDLIVTRSGDSINCKITKIKPDNIYFTFKYNGNIQSTLVPVSEVVSHKINFFSKSEGPPEMIVGAANYKKSRFAINLGPGFATGKIDKAQDQAVIKYLEELKSGFQIGASYTYFITEPLGVGLMYSRFMTSNSAEGLPIKDQNGITHIMNVSDDIDVSFYAPSFWTQFMSANRKNVFSLSYAMGLMTYRNNTVLNDNFLITGNTFGMALEMGYDFSLSEKLRLGFQFSMLSGYLSEIKIDDGSGAQSVTLEKGSYESLSRVDFSIGLRFVR